MIRIHRPATTTILVIDDSRDNRFFVKRWLTGAGYRVIEAASGRDGLVAAERQPDLILLDVQMPDMSGLEVARRLRSSLTTGSIPIIQRSAVRIDNDDVVEGLRSGASLYLTEPITAELLLAAIESLLGVRDVNRELELVLSRDDAGIYEWIIPTGEVIWSPTVQLMHGLEVGEFGGDFESFQQFVHPDERDRVFDAIQAAVSGDGQYSIVYQGVRADGSEIWVRSYGKVFFDTDGEPVKLLGVALDATEQQVNAYRLAQLHDLAGDLNAASSTADVIAQVDKAAARYGYRAVLYPAEETPPSPAPGALRRGIQMVTMDLEPVRSAVVDEDIAQIHAIAELADSALKRAWLFDVELANAEILQRALLPPQLPRPAGWSLDSIYVPTSASHRLGGDFYDALEIGDHLLLFLGDVAGHGLPAVRTMGEIRTMLRLLAIQHPDVKSIVAGARQLTRRLHTDQRLFTTVVLVDVELATGRTAVMTCGHLSPIVHSGSGAEVVDVDPLPPIGIPSGIDGEMAVTNHRLGPGDTLVLYSDGVVERRGETIDRSIERLRSLVARMEVPPTSETVAFHTEESMLNPDDRAVICVRRLE